MINRALTEVTQAVLPTPTLLLTVHVEDYDLAAVEFKNLDEVQTLSIEVRRRCSRTGDYTITAFSDYSLIHPLKTIAADLNTQGSIDLQFWGVASGAGLQCRHAGLLARTA